jgi:CRP-like cAMP-binding protein
MSSKVSIEQLRELTFLDGFPAENLEQIASISQMRQFKPNGVLFEEGANADRLYLIVSGNVLLQVDSPMTGCKPIMTIGRGELLGWSSLTDNREYAAKAVIVEPLQAIEIDGSKLRAICDRDPRFGYELLRRAISAVAKRLNVTWKQLADVRVADYLPLCATAQND